MKIFSAILAFLILTPILCFALSNLQAVNVGFWPYDTEWLVPLYLVALVPLIGGLTVGGLVGLAVNLPHRIRTRRMHKEIGVLNRKLDAIQTSPPVPLPPVPPTEPPPRPPKGPVWKGWR